MPNYYQHNGTSYVHISDYAALEARLAEAQESGHAAAVLWNKAEKRLAEVEAERDSIRTMLLNERNEWMDEAIKRQASVNEHLAALVTDAQEELRKCQQDAIRLQARLAEAEALLREAAAWRIAIECVAPELGGAVMTLTRIDAFLTPDSAP